MSTKQVKFKFEDLMVYQRAIEFANKVYLLTRKFPHNEIFGLTGQLRRASVSISLNIAEGTARTKKDFCRFLDMARGYVNEFAAILQISVKQNYITEEIFVECKEHLVEISKMLSGLKYSLEHKTASTNYEPRTNNGKV